jgi:uncharacterized protein (TIGR02147 family)
MISVYDYFDYRKLLRDLYSGWKTDNPRFSYRYIGSKVGFTSAGFFSKILQGKVNISLTTAIEFTKLFKFRKQETHYFEVLELARADEFADHVYHLNVHLFPMSRRQGGGKR